MPKIKFTTKDLDLEKKPMKTFEPGEYSFKITGVKLQIETSSGWVELSTRTDDELEQLLDARQRMSVDLSCYTPGSDGQDAFKVFETIYFSPKAAWKYKQFCKSLGLDSDDELDTNIFWDKMGYVYLQRKSDEKYLTPSRYLTELGNPAPKQASKPSPVEDTPF